MPSLNFTPRAYCFASAVLIAVAALVLVGSFEWRGSRPSPFIETPQCIDLEELRGCAKTLLQKSGVDTAATLGTSPGETISSIAATLDAAARVHGGVLRILTFPTATAVLKAISDEPRLMICRDGRCSTIEGAVSAGGISFLQLRHGMQPPELIPVDRVGDLRPIEVWELTIKPVPFTVDIGRAEVQLDKIVANVGLMVPSVLKSATFRVTNIGTTPVLLGKPQTTCSCTVASFKGDTELAAGQQLDIDVVGHLTSSSSFSQRIILPIHALDTNNQARRDITFEMIGNIAQAIDYSPKELSFADINPGEVSERSLHVTETAIEPISAMNISTSGVVLSHRISVVGASPNRTFLITFNLDSSKALNDDESGQIFIDTDSKLQPRIVVPVTVRRRYLATLSPSVMSFGHVSVDARPTASIDITGPGDRDVAPVVSILDKPNDCDVNLAYATGKVSLRAHPNFSTSGPWRRDIKIQVNGANWREVRVIECTALVGDQ